MVNINKENGITLIALVITVILLFIIAGISITQGTKLVDKAKAETVETNMLTIKAKAKEHEESLDAKYWASENKYTKINEELTKKDGEYLYEVSSYSGDSTNYAYYDLGQNALEKMDLGDLWEGGVKYVVAYPIAEGAELDIIYINGITYNGSTYYKLSDLQEIL